MSSEISSSSLRDTVSQFLTPAKISEIAIGVGFNSEANFTPSEYAFLLDRTTKIVVEQLRKDSHYQDRRDIQIKMVTPIVDETLSKECKKMPYDEAFPDVTPVCLRNLVAYIFSK